MATLGLSVGKLTAGGIVWLKRAASFAVWVPVLPGGAVIVPEAATLPVTVAEPAKVMLPFVSVAVPVTLADPLIANGPA